MDARLQRRVQRYGWDRASTLYERAWREQLAPAQDRLLALARIEAGERVLDVACGTGLVTLPVARAVGAAGRVMGVDLSEKMVAEAWSAAGAQGLANVEFARMDAEELDLPDESFEVALSALGILYCPDPLRALQEMRRVLVPGGRVAIAVWGERRRCGWAEIFPIVESRVESDVCPLFFQLGTGDALRMTMEAAGFGEIEVERIATRLRYASADEALAAAFAGGPVALAYSRFDEPTRASAHGDYLASIAPFADGGGYLIPGEFVVARGRRV